ncbi:MAG: endonuclease, partial [Firmicutes bacterium]|nr:endonuclease [Bacillota bacterium]
MAAKIFKGLGIAVLAVVACLALLIGFLSITEYRPKDTEILALEGMSSKALKTGEDVRLMSWNI